MARRAVLLGLVLLALGAGLTGLRTPVGRKHSPRDLRSSPARPAPDYLPLKAAMNRFIAAFPGISYGVFFKDLTSGAAFGLNEDGAFPAASTIKVPLVLFLNEQVIRGNLHWYDRVSYGPRLDWQGGAGALRFFAFDGGEYSLRVLANLAITVSDNIAARMLLRHLGRDELVGYMRRLGGRIVYPGGENLSSPRDMGRYLDALLAMAREHADGRRMLDDMANPIWQAGLPGKLPDWVTVAHQEGDLAGVAADIGVVYCSRPYILAVMSTGVPGEDVGFGNIATLSRMAYDFQERLGER